jgi:hypothetical protein
MTDDLRSALSDFAREGTDRQVDRQRTHRGIDAGALTHRVGRVRRRRAALTSATALVTVTGVLLAGSAWADRREPLPADTPTSPAPSLTPSPTPTAATPPPVLPSGDPALPFGACGSVVGAAPALPVTPDAVIETEVDSTVLPAGSRLPVSARVDSADWMRIVVAVPADGPQYAVVADGVVVGTARQHATGSGAWAITGSAAPSLTHSDRIELAVCDAPGRPTPAAGRPLPAGSYELHPWAEVATVPTDAGLQAYGDRDRAAQLVESEGIPGTVLGPVTTLTVTDVADAVEARPGDRRPLLVPAPVAEPVCGGPAPSPSAAGDLVTTVVDPAAPALELRYTGPGRAAGWVFDFGYLWAVQDGVVVGGTWYETDGSRDFDLADGRGLIFTEVASLTRCPAYGHAPLPPGDYQVYASTYVRVDERVLPDGTAVPGGAVTHVMSEPYPVTVP